MHGAVRTLNALYLYIQIVPLTILVGLCDAQGLVYAAKSWRTGHFIPTAAAISLGFFLMAILCHIYSIRVWQALGVSSSVLQTLIWLATVSIVVTVVTGGAADWSWRERLIGANALLSIAWLITQTRSG